MKTKEIILYIIIVILILITITQTVQISNIKEDIKENNEYFETFIDNQIKLNDVHSNLWEIQSEMNKLR